MEKINRGQVNNSENLPENEKIKIHELRDLAMAINEHSEEAYIDLTQNLRKLREVYTDEALQKCKIWHACIGSTLKPEKMLEMDLPGNIIENLIREKYNKWIK